MAVIEVLKWAAGANIEVNTVGIDEEAIVTAIQRHRLPGRFLQRVGQERPIWVTETLLAAVQGLHQAARARFQEYLNQIRQISLATADPSDTSPLIFLKGFSAYALTNNPYSIRNTLDIDVLAPDSFIFVKKMVDLGFRESIHHMPHEYACLDAENSTILGVDVHRYFPIWNYPTNLAYDDLAPVSHPFKWILPDSYWSNRIEYADVLQNSTYGLTPETRDVLLPDHTMTVLILCAHVFHAYVENPAFKRLAKIKLVELCEIIDLVHHERFDKGKFLALVDKYSAYDALDLCSFLLRSYLSSDPLPVSRRVARGWYPQELIWGTLVNLNTRVDDLLLHSRKMVEVVKWLGDNRVIASDPGTARVYTTLEQGQGEQLNRIILRRARGIELPLRLCVIWHEQHLIFQVSVLHPIGQHLEEIIFLFGGTRFYAGYKPVEQEFRVEKIDGMGDATMALENWGYTVTLTLPWQAIPDWTSSTSGTSVSMAIGAISFREPWSDDWAVSFVDNLCTTLVPLTIILSTGTDIPPTGTD